jgi:hypothetical protein
MKPFTKTKMFARLTMHLAALVLICSFSGFTDPKPAKTTKAVTPGRINFPREFAPSEGFVKGPEKETRKEICLNGKWDFQPIYGPYNQPKTKPYGIEALETAADLPDPTAEGWDAVKMRVPSPINSAALFPSHPEKWSQAQMGWLKRKFTAPEGWESKHVIIRFTAVSGDSKIFLNGKQIGANLDSSLPFELDLTGKLKKGENEIMVGMRNHSLFSWQGAVGKFTYPPRGTGLGIWQDVFLIATPDVYVADVFVKPQVSKNTLQAEVTVRNTTGKSQTVNLNAAVYSWINQAGKDSLNAPEIKWTLGNKALDLSTGNLVIPAGRESVLTLQATVNNKLKFWDMNNPNLYGMVVSLSNNNQLIDKKYERFGWREFWIKGKDIYLNGKKVLLFGDSQHLQNVAGWSRRYAWSFYKLLKDMGANSARLHAQMHPELFHDMADEMGIAILPESTIYASSCDVNYDSKLFWKASQDNVRRMVKKYRNHASVYGWSVENEVMPALTDKTTDLAYREMVYNGVAGLVNVCRQEDATRNWISADGSRDMNGKIPVYNDHYGMGPDFVWETNSINKPFAVGETGMAFYGMPRLAETMVGDRAYRSYKDFADAVAIDAFELLKVQRQVNTAYTSVWNVSYYGVQLLPLGITDLSKAPAKGEGIYFPEFVEGKPGIQPEMIAAYGTHYNPGYDPNYPLYHPEALFYAAKAAYHMPQPLPNKWDHQQQYPVPAAPVIKNPAAEVLFIGKEDGDTYFKLKGAGLPLVTQSATAKYIIVDAGSVSLSSANESRIKAAVKAGGTVIYWGLTPGNQSAIASTLPYQVEVFDRPATSLVPDEKDTRVAAISYRDLYFTENTEAKNILKFGLRGSFVDKGHIMLKACPTDFIEDKYSDMRRSERENPAGPALVEVKEGAGTYIVSTINLEVMSAAHIRMIGKLFRNLGVSVKKVQPVRGAPFNSTAVLTRALVSGGYRAASVDAALAQDFIGGETLVSPQYGLNPDGRTWDVKQGNEGTLNFGRQMRRRGGGAPQTEVAEERSAGVNYLSFWLEGPKPVTNTPVGLKFNVAGAIKIWVNGQEKFVSKAGGENTIENLGLENGWNHIMIKLVQTGDAWSFTGRLISSDAILASLRSALNPNFDKGNFYVISHNDSENVFDQTWSMNVDGWHQSYVPGAKAKIKFYGTGVSMKGKMGPDGGKARIYIDGKPETVLDYKRGFFDNFAPMYTRAGLKDGEHELTVEVISGHVAFGATEQWESFK